MASKRKSQPGRVMLVLLSIGLLIALIVSLIKGSSSPKKIANQIKVALERAGFSSDMVTYWIAISKFETANYTSSLFRNARNLFGMAYPTIGIDYGYIQSSEGLKSKYETTQQSVDDLVEYLIGFNYPKTLGSINELVKFMKSKGYFTANEQTYLAGVKKYLPFQGGGGSFGGHGASGSW